MARRRHPTAGLAAIGVLAVLQGDARDARGEEVARVLVLDSPGVKPFDEFVAVLRVQLRGSAGVWIGPAPAAGGLGERVGAATRLMLEKQPLLVVWVEAADERTYVVYAVGSKADRALVEVVRVPASGSLDVARVMAIKVSNLVDLVLSRAAPAPRDVAVVLAPPRPPRPGERELGVSIEAGGAGATGAGDVDGQAGLGLGGGVALGLDGWVFAGFAAARWLTSLERDAATGSIAIRELDAGIGARAGRRIGRTLVSAEVEAAGRFLFARATASDGREESRARAVPVVRSALSAELGITSAIGLRAAVGVEVALLRQRFLVLEEPVADLGRIRGIATLSAVWHVR